MQRKIRISSTLILLSVACFILFQMTKAPCECCGEKTNCGCANLSQETHQDTRWQVLHAPISTDPTQTSIYQLANGITVFLSPDHADPQVSARIFFKVGAVHDPEGNEGLAHYLEHLMFKGTTHLSTTNYDSEKIILDQIESLFDQYALDTNMERRKSIYAQIDSLSLIAAQYYIPNEYEKLLSQMGVTGLNAFTSKEYTNYVSMVPSNQLERFLKLQYERFMYPVFRTFHTELETVYEEYNGMLERPSRMTNNLWSSLFYGNHPYAITVIGTDTALRNPRPSEVMRFYKNYYVPSNMAVMLVGDIDIEKTLVMLSETLGQLPAIESPPLSVPPLPEFKADSAFYTLSKDEEFLISWRVDSNAVEVSEKLECLARVLTNGSVGILDSTLIRTQKVKNLSIWGGSMDIFSCGLNITLMPYRGTPDSQMIHWVHDALGAVERMDYDSEMIHDIMMQKKLSESLQLRRHDGRLNVYNAVFLGKYSYDDYLNRCARYSQVTPESLAQFVRENIDSSRFVTVHCKYGRKPEPQEIEKPQISPLPLQTDTMSAYYHAFIQDTVTALPLVFPDLKKDISQDTLYYGANEIPFDFVANSKDSYFAMMITFPRGFKHGAINPFLSNYLAYCASDSSTREKIMARLFKYAGSFSVTVKEEESILKINGLYENFSPIVDIVFEVVNSPAVDTAIFEKLVRNKFEDERTMFTQVGQLLNGMKAYARYGAFNYWRNALTAQAFRRLTPKNMVTATHRLFKHTPKVQMYAPDSSQFMCSQTLTQFLATRDSQSTIPNLKEVQYQNYDSSIIYFLDVRSVKQVALIMYVFGDRPSKDSFGLYDLFNAYYGVGQGSYIFQTLRESRALCYACSAKYMVPTNLNERAIFEVQVTTQTDKILDLLPILSQLECPISDSDLETVRQKQILSIYTKRYSEDRLFPVLNYAREYQLPLDYPKLMYQQMQEVTTKDIQSFFTQNIASRPKILIMVGDFSSVDRKKLSEFGKLIQLGPSQIFPVGTSPYTPRYKKTQNPQN